MQNKTNWLVAFCALLACNAGTTWAQNPLRAQTPTMQSAQSPSSNESVLSRLLSDPTAPNELAIQARDQQHQSHPSGAPQQQEPAIHYDTEIVQATFTPLNAAHRSDVKTIDEIDPRDKPLDFIRREKEFPDTEASAKTMTSKQNMGKLLSRVGMNLAFVLCAAIGFILLAKYVMKPKSAVPTTTANDESLQLTQELKLDPKITLRLVQWRDNRILVASDGEGIKSVNVMNPSFEQAFDELDQPETQRTVLPFERTVAQTPRPTPGPTAAIKSVSPSVVADKQAKEQTDVELNERILRLLLNKQA